METAGRNTQLLKNEDIYMFHSLLLYGSSDSNVINCRGFLHINLIVLVVSVLQHPYPSEEQKKQLAQDTGLTILQVNNW